MDYFALFDGHGGKTVCHLVAHNLHKVILDKMKKYSAPGSKIEPNDDDMIKLLEESFVETDKIITKQVQKSGSTGLVTLIIKNKIYCVNIGDSRAILCNGTEAVRISRDHKPDLPDEKQRIEEQGGAVTKKFGGIPRVNGILAISRSFGDARLGEAISAQPHISIIDIKKFKMNYTDTANSEIEGTVDIGEKLKCVSKRQQSESKLSLLLACDGLWDVMKDTDAAKYIAECIEKVKCPDKIAKGLVQEAERLESLDNVSVLYVQLQ